MFPSTDAAKTHGKRFALMMPLALLMATLVPTGTASAAETAILTENFERTVTAGWGGPAAGQAYDLIGPASSFSVSGGKGHLRLAPGAGHQVLAPGAAVTSTDTRITWSSDSTATGYGQIVGLTARNSKSGAYRVRARAGADGKVRLSAVRVDANGKEVLVAQVEPVVAGLVATPGATFHLRASVTGTNPTVIQAKAWKAGAPEPSAWTLSLTDTTAALQQPGVQGLVAYVGGDAAGATTFKLDDWAIDSPEAPAPATSPAPAPAAPTPAPSPTAPQPTPTPTPGTVTADTTTPAAPVVPPLVLDTFGRSVTDGWGNAEVGGAYTLVGPKPSFDVTDGIGRLVLPKGSGHQVHTAVSSLESDTTLTVGTDKLATGYGQLFGITARKGDTGFYRVRARFSPDKRIRVSAVRVTPTGSETIIGATEPVAPGILHAAGTRYELRVQVEGTNPTVLRARAWKVGTTEPTAWALEVKDSTSGLQRAGTTGLQAYVGGDATNAPIAFDVDDWKVLPEVIVPEPTPTPTTPGTTPPGGTGPTPPPPAPSRPAPGRPSRTSGAAPLGSTNYAVPAGAVFVSPSGNDTNAGTAAAPLRTLENAVKKAPAGGTVVLNEGVYHESVEVPYRKKLTIQNAPGDAVWLDGSRAVTDWVADGTAWRKDGWTTRFSTYDKTAGATDAMWRMVTSEHPMANHPEQVFIDDVPQAQVGSRTQLRAGTFFLDRSTSKLYLGTNPTGRRVAVSDLDNGLYVNKGDGSVVRGIGLRRFGTSQDQYGTLKAFANNVTIENVIVTDNAMRGIGVAGDGVTVRSTTVTNNGQLGIGAHATARLSILNSDVSGNNTEHFRSAPEAGGIKVTESTDVTIRGGEANDNDGNGIWIDNSSVDVDIVDNHVIANTDLGVHYEISGRGIIADNLVSMSGAAGVKIVESNDVKFYNNTLTFNKEALDLREGVRDARYPDARYGSNPGASWNLRNVVVRNNIMVAGDAAATKLMGVDDATRKNKAGAMVSSDYNGYYQIDPSNPQWLIAWCNYGGTTSMITVTDLEQLHAVGAETHGRYVLGEENPFANEAGGDYRLAAGATERTAGQFLPTDVAQALGVASTTVMPLGKLTD